MNFENFKRMCAEILERRDLSGEVQAQIIAVYAQQYQAWCERQYW